MKLRNLEIMKNFEKIILIGCFLLFLLGGYFLATSVVFGQGKPEGYVGPLPNCVWKGDPAYPCRDVNNLLELIVKFGAFLFFIIGAFAFAFFVYGGFTMILSFGNAEKVKKGRDILVAAIIGLIIVFIAYIAIKFLLVDVLGVKEGFVGIK